MWTFIWAPLGIWFARVQDFVLLSCTNYSCWRWLYVVCWILCYFGGTWCLIITQETEAACSHTTLVPIHPTIKHHIPAYQKTYISTNSSWSMGSVSETYLTPNWHKLDLTPPPHLISYFYIFTVSACVFKVWFVSLSYEVQSNIV